MGQHRQQVQAPPPLTTDTYEKLLPQLNELSRLGQMATSSLQAWQPPTEHTQIISSCLQLQGTVLPSLIQYLAYISLPPIWVDWSRDSFDTTDKKALESLNNIKGPIGHLNLAGCRLITNEVLQTIALRCQGITELKLADTQATEETLHKFVDPNLKTLDTLWVTAGQFSIVLLANLVEQSSALTVKYFDQLRPLTMSDKPPIALDLTKDKEISDKEALKRLESSQRLWQRPIGSLTLHGCNNLNNQTLRKIAEGCEKLTHLDLQDTQANEDTLMAFAAKCEGLNHLYLGNTQASDKVVLAFVAKSQYLSSLKLSNTQASDSTVRAFLPNCDGVKLLALDNTPTSDETFRLFTPRCQGLQVLGVAGTQISEATLCLLVFGNSGDLSLLSLARGQFSESYIANLQRKCPKLEIRYEEPNTGGKCVIQ